MSDGAGVQERVHENDPTIKGATTPILLEHRDFIYHNFLELPLDFEQGARPARQALICGSSADWRYSSAWCDESKSLE